MLTVKLFYCCTF